MWTEIALGVAQAGLGMIQNLYNYADNKAQIAKAKATTTRNYNYQVDQTKNQITQSIGSQQAGLAASGMTGAYVSLSTNATQVQGDKTLANMEANYQDQMQSYDDSSATNDLSLWTGLAGVGISLGGTLVKSGAMDQFFGDTTKK